MTATDNNSSGNNVLDSPCPPWCTLSPDAHPFDLNEVNDFERTHEAKWESLRPAAAKSGLQHVEMTMPAVERIKRDGFVAETPTFCLAIERGTDLTPDELDKLIAMLGRWRRHLELTQQAAASGD